MITVTATESKKQRIDRLCYLFLIFLNGCLFMFAADCILSALFRTPITYWEKTKMKALKKVVCCWSLR